ncbi:MAG: SgcJ/EcaC family oxidoreductase [Gemmatimonadales bacterium]
MSHFIAEHPIRADLQGHPPLAIPTFGAVEGPVVRAGARDRDPGAGGLAPRTPWRRRLAGALALAGILVPNLAPAQSAPAEPPAQATAFRGDRALRNAAGITLRVLADSTQLGIPLEVTEIVFPAGDTVMRPHRHRATEILYLLSGVLDHVVEGRSIRMEPGMLGVVPAGARVAHRVVGAEPVTALVIWCPAGELARVRPAFTLPAATDAERAPALDGLRERWIQAYQTGDSVAMADLYVVDAVRMPYDAPAQVGRPAILNAYGASFQRRTLIPTISLVPDEVHGIGDRAAERGHYHEQLRSRDGQRSLVEEGTYVALLRREPDGRWRYEWSIFNRDAAR